MLMLKLSVSRTDRPGAAFRLKGIFSGPIYTQIEHKMEASMARIIEFGDGCDIPAARQRPSPAEKRGLAYDDEVKAATDHLYAQVQGFITPMEWPAIAPL